MIAAGWRDFGSHRSLCTVVQRAWLVCALVALAACGKGTSGWVLSDRAPAAIADSGADAGAGGNLSQGGDTSGIAGQGGDAGQPGEIVTGGATGAGGSVTAIAPRCPTRFEAVCSPSVVVVNNDATASGKLFTDAVSDPSTTLSCITRDTCDILYRKVSEIRNITKITLTIEDFNGISEVGSLGPGEAGIRMSSRYLQQVSDAHGDVGSEIRGLLYYHATNIYQYDDNNGVANAWLTAGVANYVRHTAGYVSDGLRRPGGAYNDGGNTTGFFFIWLDQQYPLFVYELNISLDPNDNVTWTTQAFQDITGQSVDMLWASYQATL
jgi:hypothetical protein